MAERVLICGSRHWKDYGTVANFVHSLPLDTVIIEGEAPGADRMAKAAALAQEMTVLEFPARWDQYGRAAGPIRNKLMLAEGRPTRVVAFHNDIENSKGTKNMVEQARKAGVPVEVRTS